LSVNALSAIEILPRRAANYKPNAELGETFEIEGKAIMGSPKGVILKESERRDFLIKLKSV